MVLSRFVDTVIHKLGKPYDIPLRRSIEDEIVAIRAELGRRDHDKYRRFSVRVLNSFENVPLEDKEVDTDPFEFVHQGLSMIRKTKQRIPSFSRIKGIRTPLYYVGDSDWRTPFGYIEPFEIDDIKHAEFSYNDYRYSIVDGYIHTYGFDGDTIALRYFVTDPRELTKFKDVNNKPYAAVAVIEDDYVALIRDILYKTLGIQDAEEQIDIDK